MRVSRILFAITMVPTLILICAITATNAQTYSGQATALKSTVITGVVPGVTTAVSDTGPLPSAGGSITLASSSASIAGIVTAGASTVTTSGSGNTATSTASIEQLDVNIAGFVNDLRVRADTVAATTACTCPTGGCTGNTTITNLRIGQRAGGTVIAVTGQVNQTVVVTVGTVTLTVVINERIVSPSSITVNALHITLADSLTGVTNDVIVASAHSDIRCANPQLDDLYSGRATGVWLATSTLIPSSQTATIVADTGFLPHSGGSVSVTTAGASVPGTLSTGAVLSSTSGANNMSQSNSTVNNLNVSLIGGVTVRATVLESNTMCDCAIAPPNLCSGNSVVTNLAVAIGGDPFVINITGAPNQTVTLPLGLGTIIINEQIRTGPSDITVNALHVMLTPAGLATTDLIISHAHSDIVCMLAPSAAPASITGRVVTADGRPISQARVQVMDNDGVTWTAVSNSLGYYTVDDIPVGGVYFVDVFHKGYTFQTRVISIEDNITGLDFVAEE